jgi:hypothetical protein
MYTPQFPYLGNQVIITSGRVTHHSYDDFIFLFGKKGVSISSPYTFTVDANERTIIASPKIELGYQAQSKGEPLLLGRSTSIQLGFLLDAIQNFSKAITEFSSEEPETSGATIIYTAKILSEIAGTVKAQLGTKCLSENTYTK